MKMCHVVFGSGTFDYRGLLKQEGFRWHPGDRVWVKFWGDEEDVERTHSILSTIPHVKAIDEMADYWIQTCVDPTSQARTSSPTGFKKPRVQAKTSDFSYQVGDQIEIKGWLAKRIAKDQEIDLAFRNLEITAIEKESPKAIYVKFKYISKIAENCHLCGRALDTEVSRSCGVGPVCAKKMGFKQPKISDAQLILDHLDKLVNEIGEIGFIWIAKTQIIQTLNKKD